MKVANLNNSRDFNEIFRKDVTYDNVKSHRKQGFTLSLEGVFFETPYGGGGGGGKHGAIM